MAAEVWLAYIATVLIVMIVPGPSHLLMLSNSLTHGLRPSLPTLSAYGAGAGWLGARLRGPAGVWLHRAGGLALILAALVLSTKSLRS